MYKCRWELPQALATTIITSSHRGAWLGVHLFDLFLHEHALFVFADWDARLLLLGLRSGTMGTLQCSAARR
jgi:hypothetical protein